MKFQPQAAGITVNGNTAIRLPWNGIVLDLALFTWAGVLSLTALWIRGYLAWIFNWVWLLHALTFYSVMAGFVFPILYPAVSELLLLSTLEVF
jgi:hypothetical protein